MYRLRGKGIKNKDWFAGHLNHHSIICCMGGMAFISNWQNGALIYSCMDMSQFILQRTSRVQTLCIVTAYVKFLPFWNFFSLSFLKNIWNFTPHKNSGSSSQTAAYPIYLSLAFIPVNGTFLSANLDPLINKGIKNYDKYKISAIKPITQSRITGVSGVKFPKQKKPINALSTWQNQVHRVTKRANLLIIRKYGRIQI